MVCCIGTNSITTIAAVKHSVLLIGLNPASIIVAIRFISVAYMRGGGVVHALARTHTR